MKVVIVGGTGFIGRNVAPLLVARGHAVTILARHPRAAAVAGDDVRVRDWDPSDSQTLEQPLQGQDAVINLAGAPIADRRWTPARKAVLRTSRIETTRTIVTALSRLSTPVRPTIFISSSGIGFYGLETAGDVNEMRGPGTGFLADLCVEWEREAFRATGYGIRTTCLRTSMVLGKDGGALAKNAAPLQTFSWGSHRQGHSTRELDPRRGPGPARRGHSRTTVIQRRHQRGLPSSGHDAEILPATGASFGQTVLAPRSGVGSSTRIG